MPKRPRQLPARAPLAQQQIEAARYVGSPEHKTHKWWGGLPAAYVPDGGQASRPGKQQTTICHLLTEEDRDRATEWVQTALRTGRFRYYDGDQEYPKKIWYRDETGQLWFGLCVNGVLGEYKGWPAEEDECLEVFGTLD